MALGYSASDAGYHELFMYNGDWKKSADAFAVYIQSRKKFSVYDLIKSDIIAQQAQIQPWLYSHQLSLQTTWEKSLLNFWQAKIDADELKKVAFTRCEKTEYFFYTGYQDLQAGRTAQAQAKFKAAIAQNTYRFIERPWANYFLNR